MKIMTGGGQYDARGRVAAATEVWSRDAVWPHETGTDSEGCAPKSEIPQPPSPPRSKHWLLVTMVSLGTIFSVIAITLSIANWLEPSTTNTTMEPTSPVYSESQIAEAKNAACQASLTIDDPLTAVQQALAAFPDRTSPEAMDALARYQSVTLVETEYLKSQTVPAVPEPVKAGISKYVAALLAEVDGATRGLSDAEMNVRVGETKAAGEALAAACK
ncbi:hypothetical protein [Mycolicibacterium setense]|uniref:hypothetical protein n=1 Tax=Mycolicibacterium setense TaxID=431269 RepID=UPI0007EBFA0F|nr:hypothetical protein [Mycolicibacterium setense]